MKKKTDGELQFGFGRMVRGINSILLEGDQLSDTQNMRPGFWWKQRKGMSTLTATPVASGLRWKRMTQFRTLDAVTDVLLAHTYDGSGGEDLYQGSALPPNAITWTKKYDLTASCETSQFANVAEAILLANNKEFLIWRGTSHKPTGTWFYDQGTTEYLNFYDQVTDSLSTTNMPLSSMTTSDEIYILSEMPIDTVNITGGDFNGTASTLLGYIWNGSWTQLSDSSYLQSTGTSENEDCSDLTGWSDGDSGNGVSSQVTFQGRSTFKFDAGATAAGTKAYRQRDTSVSWVTGNVITIRLYHETIGTLANQDYFMLTTEDDTDMMQIAFASDGLYIYDGASWNEVGTNLVEQDTWQEWTFIAAADWQTCAVYLDGDLISASEDCSYVYGGDDGYINIYQYGENTSNMITYVDMVKANAGLTTETGDGFTDGTSSSNATFGQNGAISWTARTDEEKTQVEGIPGYAYKFMVSAGLDASTTVTGVTVHSPWAAVKNIWDGSYIPPTGCYVYDGTVHTDYTAYVNNTVEGQYCNLSGVTTTDKWYIGFSQQVDRIQIYMAADGMNTGAVSLTAIKYMKNTGAWTTVGTVTDTTKTGSDILSQNGSFSWTAPTDEVASKIGGDPAQMFWYEITVSAALDNPTYVYYIQGVPVMEDPDYSYGVFAYKRRAWQIAPKGEENALRYSAQDLPNVWSGPDSGYIYFGERPLRAAAPFYNESVVYADTEIWMLQGNTPDNFGRLRLSGKVGISAPHSLVSIESGAPVGDKIKVVLGWFFYDGIWLFDGTRIWKVSDPDVSNFFDPDHTDYINMSYMDQTQGEYDFETQCAYWIVYSGSGQTTPNKVIVMHFPTMTFGIYDYGVDIGAICSVINTRYYLCAGGHACGRFFQLNSGTTDRDSSNAEVAVDAYVTTRDMKASFSDGVKQRLFSVWTESQEAGGQIEVDQYPDGSDTPQPVGKASLTTLGKIASIFQWPLKVWNKQALVKFRIRNRSKNARMNLIGHSTTIDRGRSDQ
jgi:hypothetical protein